MAGFSKVDILKAHVVDWVLCIIFLIAFGALKFAEPYHRLFSLDDKTIQFPYAEKERVPMWLCIIVAAVIPFVIMTIVALAIKKSFHDWHHASLGLLMSFTLTLMITELFKNTVGRPRPDFIDRCKPPSGSVDPSFGLSSDKICTRTDLLKDGFESFLSGHSSTSFAGLGFLSLYLAGKLHVFDRKGYTYKAFAVAIPLIAATLIAISRTEDYRHHWHDVVAGSIVGFLLTYFAYRQYYPDLYSVKSDKPFSVRLKSSRPEYKSDFSFMDGSEISIRVIKHDEDILLKDSRILADTSNINDNSSTNSNDAILA